MTDPGPERDWFLVTLIGLWFIAMGAVVYGLSGCATTSFCTLDEPAQSSVAAIVNGEPVTDQERVAYGVVAVQFPGGYCTGNIIAPHTVLTASHCLENVDFATDIYVYLEGWSRFRAEEFVLNGDWPPPKNRPRRQTEGDVALVFTDKMLPPPYLELWQGQACYPGMLAVGYGRTEEGVNFTLNQRLVYETHHDKWNIYVTEGPCYGDSGSALLARTPDGVYILGVSSRVKRGCLGRRTLPRYGTATYANIERYRGWVEELKR